ncbi:50S ribosomal protein L3 [Candidatus Pacearchaeota archaeon]|nr:50S ribosomal protein L3P [uncultured archaeon]MBS3088325.1 50S ribosomal protein L3 [Candidatus Pacearchaeota archaeon]
MGKLSRPRKGSLQYWPRKRASRLLPSANFKHISAKGLLGFIAYKAGMASASVKDQTDKSLTQKKQLILPVTILEVPNMKIFSVRFYKNSKVLKDVIVSQDKELKHKLKIPKTLNDFEKSIPNEYDDVRIIAYSLPKTTFVKKSPDLIELQINAENKLEFIKPLIGKEISPDEFFKNDLLDVHGLTRGKGMQGPIKRFGAGLRFHKSEKGVRKIGSIGPWHPAHVMFRVPMAGQMGFFTRTHYNIKKLYFGKISEKDINLKSGFPHYGRIKTSYVILKGSVQGTAKRQILLTPSFRPTKLKQKAKYEFVEVLNK